MSSMSVIYNKLEKFTGVEDLTTWLKNFDRCSLIAGKTDDLVKGQLLMLFVSGQAKAVLEELEEDKEQPQKYTAQVARLKQVFDTAANREEKMAAFEVRFQQIEETEDEFMFSLVKLFRAANPDSSPDAVNTAVKRKFLQGISPSLRKGIFVFCNDPYLDRVSREQLLQDCRKAKVHFASSIVEPKSDVIDRKDPEINAVHQTPQPVLKAISDLTKQMSDHMVAMNERFAAQEDRINIMSQNSSGGGGPRFSRNRFTGYSRGNTNQNNSPRWRSEQRPSASNQFTASAGDFTCFKCGGPNHLARNCLFRSNNKDSENRPWRQ